MLLRMSGIIVVCAVLCACRSLRAPDWPWAASDDAQAVPTCGASSTSPCSESDARAALATASKYCYEVMNTQGKKGVAIGGTKLGIGTIGAISGSVIAQFAQGGAAQAWSGVSGVANGMQTQIDQSFGDAIDIKRREYIARAAFDGAARVRDAGTPGRKIELSMQMALACSMNAATADANILKLLGGNAEAGAGAGAAEPAESFELQGKRLTVHHRFEGPGGQAAAETRAKAYAAEICRAQTPGFVARAQDAARSHCAGPRCDMEATFVCGR